MKRIWIFVAALGAAFLFFMWQVTHIDWQAYRPELAAQFSDVLGAEVKLNGKLFISFFPFPTLAAENAEIYAHGVEIHAPSVRLNAKLWPLLRGRVVISSADIEAPDIHVTPELWLPPHHKKLIDDNSRVHVKLENISMDDGTITITLHGRSEVFTDVSLDLLAPDWRGPYHAEGDMIWRILPLEFVTSLGVQMPGGSRPLNFSIKQSDIDPAFDWRGGFIAAPFALHGEFQGDSAKIITKTRAEKIPAVWCPKNTLLYLTSCFLFANSIP